VNFSTHLRPQVDSFFSLCKISSLSKIDFTFQDLFQLPFPISLPSLTLSFPFFPRWSAVSSFGHGDFDWFIFLLPQMNHLLPPHFFLFIVKRGVQNLMKTFTCHCCFPSSHINIWNPLNVFFFKIYLFMATLGLFCCAGFSQVVASGGYSLWYAGSSLQWLLMLQTRGSVVHRLQ